MVAIENMHYMKTKIKGNVGCVALKLDIYPSLESNWLGISKIGYGEDEICATVGELDYNVHGIIWLFVSC